MRAPTKLLATAALALALVAGAASAQSVLQGWTDDEREAMYYGTQGSRLIPKTWLDALIMDDGKPFGSIENLTSYGLLPPLDGGASSYPIGMAIDLQADRDFSFSKLRWYKGQGDRDTTAEPWVGLNCTACHTGAYMVAGQMNIVDGAPSLFDYQSFVEGLDKAMKGTLSNADRWTRFVDDVLGQRNTPENTAMLKAAFTSLLAWEEKTDQMNQTPLRYGHGRVDAVGHILNRVLMFAEAPVTAGNASNAPVSYPFLWNIWKQHRVQYDGSVTNSRIKIGAGWVEYGALGRNTGEVLGVFGDIVLKDKSLLSGLIGYDSSVDVRNLMRMEILLKKLEPPAWPDAFPTLVPDKVARGQTVFRNRCANCHLTPDMQVDGQPTERMIPLINTPPEDLTDIWMACNAYVYNGPTGPLKGAEDLEGNILGDKAPVFSMLGTTVRGALVGSKLDLLKEVGLTFAGIERLPDVHIAAPSPFDPRANERKLCMNTPNVGILAYKARPLDGIWATAPYLHNGSVPNLWQLLLPADQRITEFWVGNRTYDPKNVGYVTEKPDNGQAFWFQVKDASGKLIEGNSNRGHEYGVGNLKDADRWALLEYLKSI
ncbi:di-heme-cytochrome C peroxidase [Rhizobium johnstonii]|uniref:di-heme-cytochrome C peroxidase n=1 Tax=Rhizobium johnstonii TaxID=3019933 RepID=UPI003F9B2CD2